MPFLTQFARFDQISAALFFVVILPVTAIAFAPFPFIFSFLLLIPAAYFFVLHLQGYLELDNIFSQIITVTVLILFFVMVYATGAYLLITVFQKNFTAVSQGFWAMLLFGIAVSGQKSVQTYVDMLTCGRYLWRSGGAFSPPGCRGTDKKEMISLFRCGLLQQYLTKGFQIGYIH